MRPSLTRSTSLPGSESTAGKGGERSYGTAGTASPSSITTNSSTSLSTSSASRSNCGRTTLRVGISSISRSPPCSSIGTRCSWPSGVCTSPRSNDQGSLSSHTRRAQSRSASRACLCSTSTTSSASCSCSRCSDSAHSRCHAATSPIGSTLSSRCCSRRSRSSSWSRIRYRRSATTPTWTCSSCSTWPSCSASPVCASHRTWELCRAGRVVIVQRCLRWACSSAR
mmetsp:Transcript_12596/g.34235  ORF Transcript_12596/g.34235 Transcript_12596/m.34235 type:complete len:225 (-) Transcript_12596:369-1043(-)